LKKINSIVGGGLIHLQPNSNPFN